MKFRPIPPATISEFAGGIEFSINAYNASCRSLHRDLLTRDYLTDHNFSVSTISCIGVALTSTATKKGSLSTGDVGAVYKYNNILFDVKVDTQSKLDIQYFHSHACLTSAVALNQTPVFDFSATIGTPTFVIGAEAGYEPSSGRLTKYIAGISVNKPHSSASIILTDKGDTLKAAYIHHLDESKKTAAVGEITRRFSLNENIFTVGGSYAVDSLTVVKAKLNNHGKLGAVLQHEIIPKSFVTVSSEFETNALNKTPKFGLALALKP